MIRTELYTEGGEFNLPDGTNYIGAYHVHITQGAMVGGFHKVAQHDRLTPANRAAEVKVQGIILELVRSRQNQRSNMNTNSSGGNTSSSGGY
jgi:hypothetical protein